jgi:hypothetical protein
LSAERAWSGIAAVGVNVSERSLTFVSVTFINST